RLLRYHGYHATASKLIPAITPLGYHAFWTSTSLHVPLHHGYHAARLPRHIQRYHTRAITLHPKVEGYHAHHISYVVPLAATTPLALLFPNHGTPRAKPPTHKATQHPATEPFRVWLAGKHVSENYGTGRLCTQISSQVASTHILDFPVYILHLLDRRDNTSS
ncbi:unnamed protein product, partial [Ectocarpus sp. 4 AP-2014]